jgi:hypothetical protein
VVYQSKGIKQSSFIFFSQAITNSSYLYNCVDCIGSHHCIQCSGLRNQSYCINNEVVGKEKFEAYFRSYKLDKKTDYHFSSPYVYDSENVENAYFVANIKNGRNLAFAGGGGNESIELYDVMGGGTKPMNDIVACMTGTGSEHVYCGYNIVEGSNNYYSWFLDTCSFCLGCIGLKNKQFCIFNKQYTKEERYEKVNEIFTQMEKD